MTHSSCKRNANTPEFGGLLKTHDRDLIFSKRDNQSILSHLVEESARTAPPIVVPPRYSLTSPICPPPGDTGYRKIEGTNYEARIDQSGAVSWGLSPRRWGQEPYEPRQGWAGLYAAIYGLSKNEAVSKLSGEYGINPAAPFELLSPNGITVSYCEDMQIPDGSVEVDGINAECKAILPVNLPYDGVQYFLGVFHASNGTTSHLPFYLGKHGFRWGFYPKQIPLVGLDELERNPTAKVLIVDDAFAADRINHVLHLLAESGNGGYVAVAFWAGCSRVRDYNYAPLAGRDMIYIPTLYKDSLVVGIDLREQVLAANACSFNVVMRPIVSTVWDKDEKNDCGEYACAQALNFTRRGILALLNDIEARWDFKRYRRFGEDEGLMRPESVEICPQATCFKLAKEVRADAEGATAPELSFSSLFSASNITLIVGDSDSGKTLLVRTLAVAMSVGVEAFGIKASPARPVYLINAEQDCQKSALYTDRAMGALNITDIPEKLFDRPELSADDSENTVGFDILDPHWQKKLVGLLEVGSVLVVDNLLSTSEKSASHASHAQKLRQFALELKKKNVSLIVVHHTGKNGEGMGSQALENLAQNFVLVHQAETADGFEGGVNAKVTFKKIKGFPPYKGKTFLAQLAYATTLENATPWEFCEVSLPTNGSCVASTAAQIAPDVTGLPQIDKDILRHAHTHGQVTKKDIIDKGHKEGTVKEHFRNLLEQGKLIKHGEGRGTYYGLPLDTEGRK